MHFTRTYVLAFFSLLLAFPVFAQQPSTTAPQSSTQALALLQKSLAALTGGQPITDVTLSGTARRIAGSEDETGNVVFKAVTTGAARMDLSLSSGLHSEVANLTRPDPAGSWSGPDGASHPIAFHNLVTEPVWFFPAFSIARGLSASGYVITYVGQETREGQGVQHVSVSRTFPVPDAPGAPTFRHLTQVDFFFDSTTLLPTSITFNIHPDNDASLDLPVEIHFSDYRSVGAAQLAFHIQKFLNNSLVLDFHAQTVSPNTGLPASTFDTL